MKVRFLVLARLELDDAVDWYNRQSSNLGQEFLDELDRAVRRVIHLPLSCAEIEPGLRRCLLARFSYGLIYGREEKTIVVIAVAHLHREPHYWLDRIE